MKTLISRTLIAADAVLANIGNRFKVHKPTNKVLVIFQQVFGDSIILLPALRGYIELFHNQKGYDMTMICLPSIKKFLDATAVVTDGITIETVDYKKIVNDYHYYREIRKKYEDFADISIVTGASLSANLVSTTLNCKERHGLISCYKTTRPLQMALFERLAYTDAFIPPVGSMMIERHRMMLHHLGLKDYKGRLSQLIIQDRIINNKYCVICPGASTPVKCWPVERFAELADWIIETYNLDVHLCGGAPEQSSADKFLSLFRNKERIFNHVGKTTFKEWASIVQHSKIVIGNDSATAHIAAASKVKCICIAGVYDKFQFFPYKVDELREGEFLPETVFVDMPCSYCRTKGYFAGYNNKQCKAEIKAGKCALCIEKITVDMVKEKVIGMLQ